MAAEVDAEDEAPLAEVVECLPVTVMVEREGEERRVVVTAEGDPLDVE